MAIQYAPLFALETQFQTKDGRNNTGGWLKVFLAATDDPATTYSDYNGTRNPEKIVLDDDGRALVICDKSKAYRLEVYDINGTLLWTEEPVYCSGTGGGGVSITKVISTDGSISIDENVAGSTTTYDIGLAPNDSDEFLEWIKCSEKDCGATWYPVFQDGSMETDAGKGIKVHKGHLYHFTNSFTVDPNGTGVNYDTFRVTMYCGDNIVDEHDFDIDSSLNDQVLCEFSRDLVPSEDTHVYFKLTIPSTCKASGEVQCHRIYSGINAVPDTCATKQWVSASYQPLSGMSSFVTYSAVGNNSIGQVTGINGSAIAGSLDSATVSSIASSVASAYTESAFSSLSSKADSSALSAYQPVSAMGAYATTAYVESSVSGKLDTSAFASASAGFAPAGDYAFNSSLGSYIPASASGSFAPSGDYAFNSAVSSKLDASASGNFVMNSATTSWIPYSALGYSGTAISGIGGSSLAGMGGGADYTGVYPVNVDNDTREIAVDSMPLVTDSSMTSYASAGSSVIGVNLDILSGKQDALAFAYNTANQISSINGSALGGMDEAAVSGIASAYAQSAASSKLDSSAFNSADFYSTSNPSGFVGSAYVDSTVSGKLDSSAFNSADFYSTSNPSGFITGVDLSDYATTGYVDSSVSSKLDTTAFNSADFYSTSNPSGFITGVDLTPYQEKSAMGAYQPSGNYYSASNPSGFITGVDLTPYQPTSAMSGYIPTSLSSDFQQVSGMSSYALSSDVSATVELVGTQSANWGGSALQLSAGHGVKLEKSGNVLVASTDETVLWENSTGERLYKGITLNESRLNFEMLRFYMGAQAGKSVISYDMPMFGLNRTQSFAIQPSMPFMDSAGTGFAINWEIALSATETSMSSVQALYWGKNNFGAANTASGSWTQGVNNPGVPVVYKVIGINRTAGV